MQEATDQLNSDLEKINTWANKWLVSFNPQKTKSMVVTLKKNLVCPNLYFNNHLLQDTTSHKHLGIEINSTLTWNQHIDTLASSANKKLNVFNQLSKLLDRKTLHIMYTSFIRPCLEYGNIVWCNCTTNESESLEAIQRRAARIITGGIIRTNKACLYEECALESLEDRRDRSVLLFFHKIINGKVPVYLNELKPSGTMDRQQYNLRQQNNYTIPKCRLTRYQNSFLPRAINMWNMLPNSVKSIHDYDSFKRELEKNVPLENPLYLIGNRKENILMARIRMNCSDLKSHLFNLNIIDTAECRCGYQTEDSYHFFFTCPLFGRPRVTFHNIVSTYASFTLRTVLYGRENLNFMQNKTIICATIDYINSTKRFEN